MAEIKYIPIRKLWQHPDNPRKDLGDLTELADSIKVNGILQNLTVVPLIGEISEKWDGESYRVIIGHRRLAAAKLAGLKELPCVVVEMSEREQLSTMLTENMQRSDLTVYEQAQGFQMMLNMGDAVEDIAEKSGFSTTTVRRRVKLLELDKDKFKKSEERGVSLFEYMELDKLKSPERKNEMLDYIGTENFKYKLKQAIDAEADDERKAKWVELLSAFATQVDSCTGYRTVKSDYVSSKIEMERPADADTVEYFFCIEKWGYIALMVKDEPASTTLEEEAKKREEQLKQERKNASEKALSAATARAYELRADFVATVSAAAIKKLPPQDLIRCGRKAIDSETGHIGPQLAYLLGLPAAAGVLGFSVSASEIELTCARDGFIAALRGRLPAVLSVCNGTDMIRRPTIPGLRQAKRAEILRFDLDGLDLPSDSVGESGSPTRTIRLESVALRKGRGRVCFDLVDGTAELLKLLGRGDAS